MSRRLSIGETLKWDWPEYLTPSEEGRVVHIQKRGAELQQELDLLWVELDRIRNRATGRAIREARARKAKGKEIKR